MNTPPIRQAAAEGDLARLRELLADSTPTERAAALGAAAEFGRSECLSALLESGVKADSIIPYWGTALQAAADGNHLDCVELLLGHDADPCLHNPEYHRTPLYRAAREGNAACVRRMLIRLGSFKSYSLEDINDIDHETALHAAVRRNATNDGSEQDFLGTVRALLEYGADIDARDRHLQTPLIAALQFSDVPLPLIRLLLQRGADVNARDEHGSTALHYAAAYGQADVVELLLAAGAELHARAEDGYTPLHDAATSLNEEAVRLLLARGADATARDHKGRTPLHEAAWWQHDEDCPPTPYPAIMKLLLEHGASVNARDARDRTPLHLAARRGNAEAVGLLIGHGALLHALSFYQRTPLHLAAKHGHARCAALLLEAGACPNIRETRKGYHPLYLAARKGHADCARILLQHGASVDALDFFGRTPLQGVDETRFPEMAALLREHGAKDEPASDSEA